MAKNNSKEVFEKYRKKSETVENKSKTVHFEVDGTKLYIKKWNIKEVMERADIVGHLFVLPQTTMLSNIELSEDESENVTVDMSTVMYAFLDSLSRIEDMSAFLDDLTSCVYLEETDESLDINEHLSDKPENLCKVLQEVLNYHFLFLFNGDLTNLLWTGRTAGETAQMISQVQ